MKIGQRTIDTINDARIDTFVNRVMSSKTYQVGINKLKATITTGAATTRCRFMLIASFLLAPLFSYAEVSKPNIIFIMSDDQGYGDVSAFNPNSKINTPAIDRLAKEGMMFTDAHSASAVCTPTRYGVLTGRYPWRTRLQKGVLGARTSKLPDGSISVGDEPLIDGKTLTVAQFLKGQGYDTAITGKWHLGFKYILPKDTAIDKSRGKYYDAVPVGTKIVGGPIERGFDKYWGFHHARQMGTWIEQDEVTYNLENTDEMLNRITVKAVDYVSDPARKAAPFFLYVPFSAPHSPVVPSKNWIGKSGINKYADFVMETNNSVERILHALDKAKLSDNTIVIFTTDNGTSPSARIEQLIAAGHHPTADLRGTKADIWEGGHRVPYIVRWPGHVKAGSTYDKPVVHNSLFATSADILNVDLPNNAAVDSFSILPALKGSEEETHPIAIHASVLGHFAVRVGDWKLATCKGSCGWSKGGDKNTPMQLYNMKTDRAETTNLFNEKPDIVAQLKQQLEQAVYNGYTVDGKTGSNDVPVTIYKKSKVKSKKISH
ncbi:arylsulfatase [Pseudoalteromonas sp. A601]|uniref:sulfatase family protein n=1 Tax=Pseudoalteromonas sp. A601 TaxID=1967839 RepID=UPI001C3E2DBE|nr:arylsulfatase [Pseudoalteromonas sp. A601]